MTKPVRPLPVLLLTALLAFVAVGCGVDAKSDAGGDTPTTEATPTTEDETTTTGAEEEETTTTEAEDDETTTTEAEDDETTTTEADDTVPSLPDGIEEQMTTAFKGLGLTDEQASCLAGAYLDKFGAGASATPDYTEIFDLFTVCDIDPTQIGG